MGLWSGNFHSIPADGFEYRKVATVHGLAGSFGAVGGILFNTLVGHFMATGQTWAIFFTVAMLMPCGVLPLWIWLRDDAPALRPAAVIRQAPDRMVSRSKPNPAYRRSSDKLRATSVPSGRGFCC
jgi:hypothetical protein